MYIDGYVWVGICTVYVFYKNILFSVILEQVKKHISLYILLSIFVHVKNNLSIYLVSVCHYVFPAADGD